MKKQEIIRIQYKDLAEKIVKLIDEKTNSEHFATIEIDDDCFMIVANRKNKRIMKKTVYYICGLADGFVDGYFTNP